MEFLGEMFAITAADKAIEKSNNEIRYENFIPQAKKTTILTLIPNCQIQKPGWFSDDVYFVLYYYLVKKNVIKKKTGIVSMFTWSRIFTINPDLIETSKLKELINKDSSDFPDQLKCYTLDYEQLSTLLKNYKYAAVDELNLLTNKGGRRKKNNKNKNKTKKRNNIRGKS